MIRSLLLVLALLFAASPGRAQDDTQKVLEEAQRTLDGVEAELKGDLDDARLADVRGRVDPLTVQLGEKAGALGQAREAADRRLAELAPPPGDNPPADAPEIAQQRADQAALRQAVDAQERQARLLLVRADQAAQTVNERRRAQFTARILDDSRSILDPSLWADGGAALSLGLSRLSATASNDLHQTSGGTPRDHSLAVLAAFAAVLLAWPLRRLLQYYATRLLRARVEDPKLRRSALAFSTTLVAAGTPALAALAVGLSLDGAGLLPGIVGEIALHLLRGVAFVALAHGLAVGLLQPDEPALRLAPLGDPAARALRFYPGLTAAILVLGKVVQIVLDAFRVPLSATILTSAVFAVAAALTMAAALRSMTVAEGDDPAPDSRLSAGILRAGAWIVVLSALAAVTIGYVQLASFLTDQLVRAATVGAILYLLLNVVDDALTAWAQPAGLIGRLAARTVGVRSNAFERLAVLLSGLVRALLIVVAVFLILAPWGVQSNDTVASLRAALFGFEVGGLRISLGQVFAAILLFGAGYAATRLVQRWLDRRLMPKTDLDSGLKSSISTGIGYLGVLLAVVAASTYLGFSLDKVAVLAGALSLGIGFGLQSIVNNFVSGVILLAERPIKPGDWVAIGADEGNVERISVRSTEIALFDGSTLVVPNADLITKSVRNITLRGRPGRVKVDFGVAHGADPDAVRALVLQAARRHEAILASPEPAVQITAFRDAGLTYSLFCHVASPRIAANAKSDLSFDIVRDLQGAGIRLG